MMNTTVFLRPSWAGFLFLLTLAGAPLSSAQGFDESPPDVDPKGTAMRPPIHLVVDHSSTAGSTTAFRGLDRNESGATSTTLILEGAVPLSRPELGGEFPPAPPKWMMPLGLTSQNVCFDEVPGAPVPESVHTFSLNLGLGYRWNEKWMFMARVRPTLYRTGTVDGDDAGVSGGVMAMWRRSPTLTWMFGVMADPDGEFRVLPIVGANWAISPELTLSLMVPRPRLIYRPDLRWSFHVGANLNGATFRTSDTFGTERGEPRYNHVLASYRDLRLGAGFELRVNRRLSFEAEGGCSLDRQIDYTRIDERVEFGSAPYFQLGLRAKF